MDQDEPGRNSPHSGGQRPVSTVRSYSRLRSYTGHGNLTKAVLTATLDGTGGRIVGAAEDFGVDTGGVVFLIGSGCAGREEYGGRFPYLGLSDCTSTGTTFS